MNETLAAVVRRHDPDRFLTALFAPAARRDALLTLYAFNHELARAREVASEPALALIRLQWWREVVEGAERRHEIASPLTACIKAGTIRPEWLLPLLEARETEAYAEFETRQDWTAWLLSGAGGLAVAAAGVLGVPDPGIVRPFGAAYGVTGLLRSVGWLARQGRCLLPLDVLQQHGLSRESFLQAPNARPSRDVLTDIVREGEGLLAEARTITLPRIARPAALPAVLARRDLRRWPVAQPAGGTSPLGPGARGLGARGLGARGLGARGLGDRLAVVRAAATGRIAG